MKPTRFDNFRAWLRRTTGDHCDECVNGRVIVRSNQFSPARYFACVGHACDHFAHLMNNQDRVKLL